MGKNDVYENRVSNIILLNYASSYEKVKSPPYILFSRYQRGFNVTNTSTEGNINESDTSNGEFYMIRHGWY